MPLDKEIQVSELTERFLEPGLSCLIGRIPPELDWDKVTFDAVWNRHPVKMLGKWIEVPRWQQAYGANYTYTGSRNNTLPVPQLLAGLLHWTKREIDERLNGLLLNWFEGSGDYIGPHNDSTKALVQGAPIVTVSFGETRLFRLEQGTGPARRVHDFDAVAGTVFMLPFATSLSWKHSVPKRARYRGRWISVTFRAFETGVLPPDQYWERTTD